jgi:tetratricopeptide (TPR) repeat protein
MFRFLGKLIRRRPGIVVLFLLLVAAGAVGGVYVYARQQWEAAQLALKEERSEEARRRLRICLMVWPRSIPVHILAARAARSCGDFEAAEAHLNRCLKLDPQNTDAAQIEFLLMRVQQGEVDDVTAPLMNCVENHWAEAPLILSTLARAYMHNVRYGPALMILNRWIHEAPEDPRPYHWRGWIMERMNDHQGAIRDYEQALQLDPNLVSARLRLAEMALERNAVPEALRHLEQLTRQHPERADVMARMGQCRFLMGEKEEARRLLEAAAEQLPNDPILLLHLAKLDLDKQPARAEQWLRRILKVDSTDTEAWFTLVKALRLQGRETEADAAEAQHKKDSEILKRANKLLQAEAMQPSNDPDVAFEIGSCFLRAGQDRLALYWLHQALQRDRQHQPAHRLLAEHYEKTGDNTRAANHRRQLRSGQKAEAKGAAGAESAKPR